MPGQGEQHSLVPNSMNPFEEVKPHVNEYTAQEIATLSSRLEKQLGPEYISSRPGAGGGKVHYLSADKCINLANEVFGFNGWSSGIQNIQIDFVDENSSTGKISLGLSVIVRVTLRDGTFHEDVGYGHIENCKGKAAAFEKAKKEGTTDGLKRALRNFGNLLGNCVYDKEYVAKVTKLKIAPTKWDPDNLHRHPDFAPTRCEGTTSRLERKSSLPQMKREWPLETEVVRSTSFVGEGEDEFGSDDFDEVDFSVPQGDHPDEISLDPAVFSEHLRRRNSLPSKQHPPPSLAIPQHHVQAQKSPTRDQHPGAQKALQTPMDFAANHTGPPKTPSMPTIMNQFSGPRPPNLAKPAKELEVSGIVQRPPPPRSLDIAQPLTSAPELDPPDSESSISVDHDPPVGFITARAAECLQSSSGQPTKTSAFDPHLESPSIRKTAGVDHSKTKPIIRDVVATPATSSPAVARGNMVNLQADKTRRLGMPGGGASPLRNRGTYKPPSMKRPAEGSGVRLALEDVTAASVNAGSEDAGDLKRQKVEVVGQGGKGDGNMLNN